MELRVILEKLSSIGPEIDFLKSNKVLEKITNALYQTSEHAHAPYFFCHHDHGGKGAAAAALDWSIGPMFGVVFVVTGFPRPQLCSPSSYSLSKSCLVETDVVLRSTQDVFINCGL